MKPWSTETKKLVMNGKTLEATLNIYCEADDLWLDVIGDDEDREELARKISNGSLFIAYVRVSVSFEGIEGSDSLSGCYVSSPEDVKQIVADHCMIDNAVDDFEGNFKMMYKTLAPYFPTGVN